MAREFGCSRELADGEQVGDAGNGQREEKQRRAVTAAVAGPDDQRGKHDDTEKVEPARWRKPHGSPMPGRNWATACSHSANQAAVRGALAGASRSSASSRIKSEATSMS